MCLHKNLNISFEKLWNDHKCKYLIENMCKCVSADPTCQYSIRNMYKWFGEYGTWCPRLVCQWVLHTNINISQEQHNKRINTY